MAKRLFSICQIMLADGNTQKFKEVGGPGSIKKYLKRKIIEIRKGKT